MLSRYITFQCPMSHLVPLTFLLYQPPISFTLHFIYYFMHHTLSIYMVYRKVHTLGPYYYHYRLSHHTFQIQHIYDDTRWRSNNFNTLFLTCATFHLSYYIDILSLCHIISYYVAIRRKICYAGA